MKRTAFFCDFCATEIVPGHNPSNPPFAVTPMGKGEMGVRHLTDESCFFHLHAHCAEVLRSILTQRLEARTAAGLKERQPL